MTTHLALAVAVFMVVSMSGATRDIDAAGSGQRDDSAARQPQPGMQDMMKMHEQMMTEMKANRSKLDALVKEMNGASGAAKIDAVAAVVTELVRQQNAMHERMSEMHAQMMSGRGMKEGPGMMRR